MVSENKWEHEFLFTVATLDRREPVAKVVFLQFLVASVLQSDLFLLFRNFSETTAQVFGAVKNQQRLLVQTRLFLKTEG